MVAGGLGTECGIWVAKDMWFSMAQAQSDQGAWVHKGLPFFRLWGFYRDMGKDWEKRRMALLTLIEDALRDTKDGRFVPDESGAYFQAQAQFGLSAAELDEFAVAVNAINGKKDGDTWCELVLEQLLAASPLTAGLQGAGAASSTYSVPAGSPAFFQRLLSGDLDRAVVKSPGDSLEVFASILFGALPGSLTRRKFKGMFETDVLVDISSNDYLARRFGGTVVVECKNWEERADINVAAKLIATMNLSGCKTGVLMSKKGFTGDKKRQAADKVALASFMKQGIAVLVFTEEDLAALGRGQSLADILVRKQMENQMVV